ncbi:PHP domain-containing protein [Accumulibacter sp.]|uniref:PHP domain-containing protein n=1 Tax=Accumulibacter sp. TaxID=2053492 RepID=UPI002620C1D3|nr:PHP domain-containing protein [Accumulibacter sp.]
MRNKLDRRYYLDASDLWATKSVPKWDFHIHTNYTDGKASVQQVFERGIEAGLEVIAFTEHAEPWRSSTPDWFPNYVAEIERCRVSCAHQIKAFIGIEANACSFDGEVELTGAMREKSEFILGAAHRYPGLDGRKVADLSGPEAIELEYKTLMGLAQSTEIDAIAHIGATCAKYCAPFPLSLTREIIRSAAHNGIAVEINPVYHKPLAAFLALCADEGALVTLGSNAHGFGDIGLVVRALQAGLRHD